MQVSWTDAAILAAGSPPRQCSVGVFFAFLLQELWGFVEFSLATLAAAMGARDHWPKEMGTRCIYTVVGFTAFHEQKLATAEGAGERVMPTPHEWDVVVGCVEFGSIAFGCVLFRWGLLAFGFVGCWTWLVWIRGCWILSFSRLSDFEIVGFWVCWILGLLDSEFVGFCACWILGFVGF